MKSIVLFSTILVAVSAQRPSFAGSGPIGVPNVAARFGNSESSGPTGSQFPNRLGTDTENPSSKLPIDQQYQKYWPRENLPFSVINAEHIRKQIHPDGTRKTSQDMPTNNFLNNRGSFDDVKDESPKSFSVFKNNRLVTYVYDSVADAWFPKKN